MAAWEYDNFDLLIETEGDGGYRARVIEAPTGESPTGTFRVPFEPTQLENLMLKLDPGRSGTRRVAADPQSQAALDLGSGLFEAVFSSDIRLAWARSIDTVRDARRGLRLRLRLTEAPAIAVLPWELLHDRRQNSFIAQSERTPVVRYLEVADTPRTPRRRRAAAHPRRHRVADRPARARRRGGVEPRQTPLSPTASRRGRCSSTGSNSPPCRPCSTWIRRQDVHVLHFVGHGEYDRQARGRRPALLRPVRSPRAGLVRRARPLPARPRPVAPDRPQRLPVRADGQLGPLHRDGSGPRPAGLRRLVSMQFPISADAAAAFTGEFYGRSPTASPSTSRSAAAARPCSPRMRRSGRRRCSSSATPRAGSSTTSFRCRRTSPPVRATRERRLRGPPLWLPSPPARSTA